MYHDEIIELVNHLNGALLLGDPLIPVTGSTVELVGRRHTGSRELGQVVRYERGETNKRKVYARLYVGVRVEGLTGSFLQSLQVNLPVPPGRLLFVDLPRDEELPTFDDWPRTSEPLADKGPFWAMELTGRIR